MAINNQANVNYTYTGARSPINNDSNITTTEILSATNITVTKYSLTNYFVPGENNGFILRVENTGSTPINSVVLSDNLGEITDGGQTFDLLEYVDGSASYSLNNAPFSSIVPTSTSPLSVNIGTMQPGDVYELSYLARALTGTGIDTITNTATATGTYNGETVTDSDSLTLTELEFANLEIVKTQSSDSAILGADFNYTINLTNTGNLEATNITVTDTLPDEFSLESVQMVQGGVTTTLDPDDYSFAGGVLTIPSGTSTLVLNLPAGESMSFILNGRFTSLETIEP